MEVHRVGEPVPCVLDAVWVGLGRAPGRGGDKDGGVESHDARHPLEEFVLGFDRAVYEYVAKGSVEIEEMEK